jgi:glucokinase
LAVYSSGSFILTFDVGGSHVSAGLCSVETLQVFGKSSAPLTAALTFEGFVDLLFFLGREADGSSCRTVGASLAVPGPFDCTSGISLMQHKLQSLYKRDLRGSLATKFGWQTDRLQFLNDAAAFLLGEVHAGAAKGASRVVGLALGTGIGSAFARDGRCVNQGESVPSGGEIWNLPYAGGIVEDLISTRALRADYLARTGKNLEVKEIAEAASDDLAARQVFETFGVHLGQVIRDVIAPFHPDIVVIGGGISRSGHLFLPAAKTQIDGLNLRLVPSLLLDEAPLVGAAAFWRDQVLRDEAHLAQKAEA